MRSKQSQPLTINQSIIYIIKQRRPETVDQLVKLIKQKYSMSEQEILEHILQLQSQGKLIFKEKPTPPTSTLSGYILSPQAYWYWVTITSALAATALVFTIPEDAYPIVYARYILGYIFTIWMPGYSFVKALFPTKVPIPTGTKELDSVERFALSAGMSLALVPLIALLLNYTPWGIREIPITLSLLALTTTLATTAIIREHQILKAQ